MKKGVIYARYSSDRQTEQSIEGQLRVCNDYAIKNDIAIIDTYIDRAMTGTNDKRTAFQQMLKDSNKRAWEYVLVYKIDRFGRNKYELAMNKHTLKLNGIRLISCMENIPDTPEGIILESMLEGMAEYYSAELSQKVKRGLKESRIKGQFTGGKALYGYYVKDKKVYINEDEAQVIRKLFSDFLAGRLVTDILDEFNEKQILYRGKPFGRNTVYNFLKNEKYIGKVTHNGEVFTNIYPPIISDEVFETARAKINNNKYGKHVPNVNYYLKFKMKCGKCGTSVCSDSGTGKNNETLRYYKCYNRKHYHKCDLKAIRKEVIEGLVIDTIKKALNSSETLDEIATKVVEAHNKILDDKSILNLLFEEKKSIEKSIDNIMIAIEKGVITETTKRRLEELEMKNREIAKNIAVETAKEKLKLTKEDVIKHLSTAISKNPQQMLDMLIKEIILFDDKIEIYFKYNKTTLDEKETDISIYKDNLSLTRNTENIQTTSNFEVEVFV